MKKTLSMMAGFAFAAGLFASTPVVRTNHRPENETEVQKPERPGDKRKGHLTAAKNNCPIYYGCPAPAPSPNPGGGGKKGGEPQSPTHA